MSRDFGFISGAPAKRLATSPLFAVASAAAIGGLTLIEPRNLGSGARSAYRITTAALTGAYTAAILPPGTTVGMPARYKDGPSRQFSPLGDVGRGSAALAAGGLTLGLAGPLEALDAHITDWLTERGVRRPRWWLAGVGVALVDAGHGPLDPAVRTILDALLIPGIPGAEALRVQLDTAEQQGTADPDAGFRTDAFLVVHPEAPRVTPRTQLWPVKGRFTREGADFVVELQVHDGQLDSLSLSLTDEMYGPDSEVDHDEAISALAAWPEPEEFELITETADPLS